MPFYTQTGINNSINFMYVLCILYSLLFRSTNARNINNNVCIVNNFTIKALLSIFCAFVDLNNKFY